MASAREGPNPLRPYYIPPSIGIPPETTPLAGSAPRALSKNATAATYASSARDIFSDIDYSDYVSEGSQSNLGIIKELLDQAMYKYLSVLLSQPFEVAKTILQVRNQSIGVGSITLEDSDDAQDISPRYRDSAYGDYPSDESDPDEPTYFTSSAPSSSSYSPSKSRRRNITDRAGYVISPHSSAAPSARQLVLRRPDSIIEAISQLWTKEGAWGVWKGTNATFVYSILLKTVESWTRSMIAAVINVPDPGMIAGPGLLVDVADSSNPWASLGVAVAAAGITGVLLAPLDIVRTKLITTSTSTPQRGFLHNLKKLPSYSCPLSLAIPTVLHSIISPLLTHSTTLLLRSRLAIDPVLTPTAFSIATFCVSTVELFLKLPIETVLRRGQMAAVSSPRYLGSGRSLESIVEIGPYRGTLGTMWLIAREEGFSASQESTTGKSGLRGVSKLGKPRQRKGQGVEGLWRGWRVGVWGLVGIWGAVAMGGATGSGGEF